jgi:hypothetical protein
MCCENGPNFSRYYQKLAGYLTGDIETNIEISAQTIFRLTGDNLKIVWADISIFVSLA